MTFRVSSNYNDSMILQLYEIQFIFFFCEGAFRVETKAKQYSSSLTSLFLIFFFF